MLTDGKTKKSPKCELFYICNNFMAGRESLNWHPLITDFILVGQKLEQLGFIYSRQTVILIDFVRL